MNRRGFLTSMLALATAPAIVRAESLMPLWVPRRDVSGLVLLTGELGRIEGFQLYSSSSGVVMAGLYAADAAIELARGVDRSLIDLILPPDDPGGQSFWRCLHAKPVLT